MKTIAVVCRFNIFNRFCLLCNHADIGVKYLNIRSVDNLRGFYFDGYLDLRESESISDTIVEMVKKRCK